MTHVLVIRLGALGDLLHMSPSIRQLKETIPGCTVSVLTSPAYVSMVSGMEGVDQVYSYDKPRYWQKLWPLSREIRNAGVDTVINLHPSLKTWLLTKLIRPKRVGVYRKQKFHDKGVYLRRQARRHAVADFYEPFRELFPADPGGPLIPRLSTPAPPSAFDIEDDWIGLIPGVGNKRSNRAWPETAYKALIEQLLAATECRIIIIGGPDEKTLGESLTLSSRVINGCGTYSIAETAAILSRCRVVVGGDTGPLHLAAAVGAPMIGLFGPTSRLRTGPVGTQAIQVLEPKESLECWPCELAECPLEGEGHLACMSEISVEAVVNACMRQLG